MYNVEKFYGYLVTLGVECKFIRGAESTYDETIIVGRGYKRAIIYSTFQSWVLETKTNLYILGTVDEVMMNLREEGII